MDVIRLRKCQRCGKTWFPRSPGKPKICPTCKTIHWDTPKKADKVAAGKEVKRQAKEAEEAKQTGIRSKTRGIAAVFDDIPYLSPADAH